MVRSQCAPTRQHRYVHTRAHLAERAEVGALQRLVPIVRVNVKSFRLVRSEIYQPQCFSLKINIFLL